MTGVLSVIFFLAAATVLVMMIVQVARGKHHLLSLRNLFLIGFVEFQLVSAGLSMATLEFFDMTIMDPARSGTIFLLLAATFLVLFLIAYERGWGVRKFAWRSAYPFPAPRPATMLTLAFLFVVIGFVLRVVIGRNVPTIGVLTDILAIGILSGAAGLAMWVWAPRLWNPAIAIPAVAIILASVVSTTILTFGRRDVISVIFTVLFAAYQSHWRHQGWLRLVYRLGTILVIGIFFLAAFSTARAVNAKESATFGDLVNKLMEADISTGLLKLATGQNAAGNSMWLIENRPGAEGYYPFHSMIFAVINPVPRFIWPNKPEGLGFTMVKEANVYRFEANYTVGAGIVGHIVNDNPWLTLVPYAIFFGLLLRFFDEFVRVHPSNPFIVLPVVAGAGDLIGIPRGEVGLFLFRSLTAMFACWVAMRLCSAMLRKFAGVQPVSVDEQEDHSWNEGDPSQEYYRDDLADYESATGEQGQNSGV